MEFVDFLLWGMVLAGSTSFGCFIFFETRKHKLLKQAEILAKGIARPITVPDIINSKSLELDDIAKLFATRDHLRDLSKEGKIVINEVTLNATSMAAISTCARKVMFKRHPVVGVLSYLLWLPIPIGWIMIGIYFVSLMAVAHRAAALSPMYKNALKESDGVSHSTSSVSAPGSSGLAEELSKLKALHRSGVLTDSEFSDAKSKLLKNGAA